MEIRGYNPAVARGRGLQIFFKAILGFRFDPPQASCFRLLRRLRNS